MVPILNGKVWFNGKFMNGKLGVMGMVNQMGNLV